MRGAKPREWHGWGWGREGEGANGAGAAGPEAIAGAKNRDGLGMVAGGVGEVAPTAASRRPGN